MAQIVTKTGENTITFDAYYQFMWCINYGDTDVYVSNHNNIVAGDDDVIYLPAGAAVRVNVNGKTLYVLGSTTLEVHAQNYSTEPIASTAGSGGGGGSITIDPTPTQGSSNAVSSGGVYTALQNIPKPVDYSTTEQNTGRKWIDGKPVYQKVVLLYSNGSLVSGLSITNNIISGDSIPSNIDTLIDYRGISERGASGDEGYVDNYVGMGTYSSFSYTMVPNKNNNTIYFNPYSAVKDVFIVYEYTKTTDTVG